MLQAHSGSLGMVRLEYDDESDNAGGRELRGDALLGLQGADGSLRRPGVGNFRPEPPELEVGGSGISSSNEKG